MAMRKEFLSIIAGVMLFAATASADMAASFQGLGVLAGGNNSWGYGISGDGSTVVGCSQSTQGPQAFRWTAASGMVGLGDLPGGMYSSAAEGVSGDGSVVVGRGRINHLRAVLWTAGEGIVDLGSSGQSGAYGVSADGSVVVGYYTAEYGNKPFRWTVEEGLQPLEGFEHGGAMAVSADGTSIVGGQQRGLGSEAILWTEADGAIDLGDLPGGIDFSVAYGISADGQTVVGYGTTLKHTEAFRWTEDEGMEGLGVLWEYQGYGTSYAWDTNGDGSVIIGESVVDIEGTTAAFIWDAQNGMRELGDVLENACGLDMSGWDLLTAKGISDDGKTIVGYGDGPAGRREAWIARIPEPNSLLLAFLLSTALQLFRRR